MAFEDLEPLTKQDHDAQDKENKREGEKHGKAGVDSLNSILTSALHKHAAKKLAKKVGKAKDAATGGVDKEKSTSKKRKGKGAKEKCTEELELQGPTESRVRTVSEEDQQQVSADIETTALPEVQTDEEEDSDGGDQVLEEHSEDLVIDSPTRNYLKAVSVPKKKNKKKRKTHVNDDGKALGVTIHCADRLEGSPLLLPHPVVQVHVCNADTGELLQKSSTNRKVTSYYEGNNVDHILPIMTQPYDLQKARSLTCRWEEQIIFNESIQHLCTREPQVVIFFQLMDFPPPPSTTSSGSANQPRGTAGHGWTTFAWAFLKVCGANDQVNIGSRLRLQLWRPRKHANVQLKEVHSWWRSGSRIKYNSTLYVTLMEVLIPKNPRPALRSMLVTQQEEGGGTVHMDLLEQSSTSGSVPGHSNPINKPNVNWSRKQNQPCKIVNHVRHCLSHIDEGCLVVKFSNCGLKLACGAYKQLLIYDVIEGNLERSLTGHLGLIYDVSWSNDSDLVLTASADSTARVWNLRDERDCGQDKILPHPSYVYCARFLPARPSVTVTGCFDHVLRVWFCDKGGKYTVVQELMNHLGFVNALCFSPEGDILISGDKLGVLLVWNVDKHKKEKGKKKTKFLSLDQEVKISDIAGNIINAISFHPSGYRVLIHTRDSQLRLVNHIHWTVTHRLRGLLNVREQVRGCISPCGSWVISGSEDNVIYFWNSDSGEMVSSFMDLPIKGTISGIDYHPHDHLLAVCSYSSESPVLILDYSQDVQSSNNLVPLAVQPMGSVTSRSPSPSFLLQKRSPMPAITSNVMKSMPTSLYTDTTTKLEPDTAYNGGGSTRVATSVSEVGKDLWKDHSRHILTKLDSVLKLAGESPQSLPDYYESQYGTPLLPQGQLANALYDYHTDEPDELAIKQGDFVMVIEETNRDWWLVRTADLKHSGLVPSSYLERLPSGYREDAIDWIDTGRVIAVPSESGDVSFMSDSEGTPSKARARRHRARMNAGKPKTKPKSKK